MERGAIPREKPRPVWVHHPTHRAPINMTVKIAHLLFEQSGTFKRAFAQLGIKALDYDLQNAYGETDVPGNLFSQINRAYMGQSSIFDDIEPDDIVMAFFPCIYFCETNMMYFCGYNHNQRNQSQSEKIKGIIDRSQLRQHYYELLLQLCYVCEVRQIRLIIENPYNAHHYLRFNFPYKPAVIDMNRRLRGDDFKKPTQYFFINCTPAGKQSVQLDKVEKYIRDQKSADKAGICSADRSMINPDYANNFICDHILGIESGHTQRTLFDS